MGHGRWLLNVRSRNSRRSHSAGRVHRPGGTHPRRGRALTSADQPGGQAIILQGTVIVAVSNGPLTVDSMKMILITRTMHIARLKHRDPGRYDFTCIRYSTLY